MHCLSSRRGELPAEIVQLTWLQTLDLSSNELGELPAEIGQLTWLQNLYLSFNQLSELPAEIGQLEALRWVALGENSRQLDTLQGFADENMDRFRSYLRSLKGAQRLYEAKLLLVGEGAVGKSTLLAAMRGETFEEGRDSTHGIEVRRLCLGHPELANTRALLRALATENNACPRTFTLLPEGPENWSLAKVGKIRQRLTLWCEHPDNPHPTCAIGSGLEDSKQGQRGEYVFESSKEWLRKVVPLANRVAKALKILVPVEHEHDK